MKSFVRAAWVMMAILAGLSAPTLASDGNSWSPLEPALSIKTPLGALLRSLSSWKAV